MKVAKIIAIVACCVLAFTTVNGFAKDLKGSLGIGFNSQLSPQGVDSISAKYWFNNELCLQGLVGFRYTDDVDETDIGAKINFKIKDEENLHVDAIVGIGFAHVNPDEGDSDTATWMSGGVGIEYFFSGLPNLGFSTEVGLTVLDYDNDTAFGTSADTFVGAGIHYYFDFLSPTVKQPEEK
ncbi:MAG: hypothetical protein P8Y38_01670 [Deltaproteobacteria bacterium]|jgi:hypothetical protein